LFSNHTAPLDLEEGDRRYFVFESKAQPQSDDYYDRLHRFAESANELEGLYAFLARRDLSAFNPHRPPPMTAAKRSIIETSGHPLRDYIRDAVESGHILQQVGPEFSLDALQRQLAKDGYGPQAKNERELARALEAAGAMKSRKRVGKTKRRLWQLPLDIVEADSLARGEEVQF
jgi:hypothetical protein